MAEDKVTNLYNAFVKNGYAMESEAQFRENLKDPKKRKAAYDALVADGYNMEPFADFESNIGFGAPAPAPTSPAPQQLAQPTATAAPASSAPESAPAPAPVEEPEHAQVQSAPEEPAQPAWQPTEQEKIRMSYQLHTMMNDFNQRSRERIAQTKRMTERMTPEGRKKLKATQFQAQLAGTPTKVMGLTPDVSVAPADGQQATAEGADAPKPLLSGQSPVPYGVVIENGERKTQWLLPDGRLTTSLIEADQAEFGARRVRLMNQFVGRMKENGLDPAKQEDVQKQAQLDYEAPMRKVLNSVWAQAEEEDRVADEEYRREMEEYNKTFRSNVRAFDPSGMPLPTPEENLRDFNRAVKRKETFNLESMANTVLNNLPASYRQQSLQAYQQYFTAHTNELNGRSVQQAAQDALRSEVYNAVYQRAVDSRMPKSKMEFLFRKIGDQPLVSPSQAMDMAAASMANSWGMNAAEMDAMGQYGQQHRALDITGTVLNMAFDPTVVLSGSVGGAAGKWAMKIAGKQMIKGATKEVAKEVAERFAARTLTGRVIGGMAGGAANFATFEALKNVQSQMAVGGVVNPETGEREFSFGEVLKAGGHGLVLGGVTGSLSPIIGNVADKYVKATSSTGGKMLIRSGELVTSTLAEGTIFSAYDIYENSKLADDDPNKRTNFDIWSDSMAMMLGFKVSHMVKSAPQYVASLRPIKPTDGRPLTQAERRHNRMNFEERLRKRMDACPRELDFTKEERDELRRAGYGELADLFTRREKGKEAPPEAKPEHGAIDFPIAETQEVGKQSEFDGYDAMERLMQDGRVSQAARAKAYFILTGRMLPMGSVTGYTTQQAEDGTFIVNSVTADGEVVTSRVFADEAKAQTEINNINRQAELNTIDVGERYAEQAINLVVMDEVKDIVAARHKLPAEAVENIYMKHFKGENLSEAEMEIVNDVNSFAEQVSQKYRSLSPEAMRESVEEQYGVNVDEALCKTEQDRSATENEAVKEYASMLYQQAERQRKANSIFNAQYNEMRTEYKENLRRAWKMQMEGKLLGFDPEVQAEADRAYAESHRVYDRFEQGDPTAQADIDAIGLRMQEAYQMCEDAFGAEAEYWMYHVNENPWSLIHDNALTPDQQEAVLYYINSKAALDGVMDASHEASQRKREQVEQEVAGRTHKERGVIIPAVLKVDDKPAYIVKGDVVMYPDGSGVDATNSSESIVIMDESGEYKFVSPDQIYKVGESIDPQDELQTAYNQIDAEQQSIFGVDVPPEPEAPAEPAPEPIPEPAPEPEAPSQPIVDTSEYDRGYEQGLEEAAKEDDAWIDNLIKIYSQNTPESMSEDKKGRLDAYRYEQQRRAMEAQSVPEMPESVLNPTENAVSEGEIAPETVPSVENVQQTALSRIPIDEATQEPQFTAVDPETAWDGLVEAMEGEANALPIAQQMIEDANKKLEALNKKPPTPAKPKLAGKAGPMAMRDEQKRVAEANAKAQEEYQQALATAQAEVEAWNNILRVYTSRNAELRRQRDAEAHDAAVARFEEEQRIKADKQAEQERIGVHAVNPKIREKWDSAPKIEGHTDAITLPDGSTVRGRYVLTEAGAASASHDVNNAYMPTEGFPIDENGQSVNDRDYMRDKEAQRIVEQMAGAYDNRALQTPVIVSKDGVVLSGNNRTMSGDLAARQGTDKAYVDYLREFGHKYGFTPEQVQGMSNPRLVFVPDENLPYDATTFSRFNAQEMKSQSKPEAAVKLGKIVPDNVFTDIVTDISRYDRLSDYYADEKAIAHALGALMQAGVINDKQMPEMRTGTALSAAGKELIENTLIGKVFQTSPDAVRQIISMPTLRQSIVMGLNEIANNSTLARNGYDISEELAKAVDLVTRAKAAMPDVYTDGMPVSPFGRMQGLFDDEFGDSRVTDATALLLADILNSGKPSDLRKVLTSYNNEASQASGGQIDIFSGSIPTKEEILTNVNEHFRNATPKEQQALVDAAIVERKRRAEAEAEQRGRDQESEQTPNDVERRAEPQQPSAVADEEQTPEEQALAARIEVTDNDWAEGEGDTPTYKRNIIIDGTHKATQVDAPDEDGHYTGSYFEFDGKHFGDITEIAQYIDGGMKSEPTEAQKAAGNYKMEHRRVDGYNISIENAKGSVRRGTGADGKPWETTMQNDYGYIRGTEGVDGDHIDVFLSDTPEQGDVFVVDQVNEDGSFDEHKVMYGFPSVEAAREAYLSNYEQGWTGLGAITHVSKEEFKKWIGSSKRKTKPFAEYKSVKPIFYDNQGNPIDENGNLIIENVKSVADITDADFNTPSRTIGLPALPGIVQQVLSTNGKRVIIKKNIFERNALRHDELTPAMSRTILSEALYNTTLYGKNKPLSRPNNWIVINVPDGKGNNKLVVLEVNDNKDNVEIVHWHEADERGLEKIKRQAEREDGQLLILPSETSEEAGALSGPTFDLPSDGKDNTFFSDNQESAEEKRPKVDESADKQTDGAESSLQSKAAEPVTELYTITPAVYVGKSRGNKPGKETPMHRVTFNRPLTEEQERAVKAFANEAIGEKKGRFATKRGWADREAADGSWLFRTEEDARKAGEMIGNEEAVADAQPLSREELREAVAPATMEKKPAKPKKAPINRVSLEDVMTDLSTKGETKLSDHAEPIKAIEYKVGDVVELTTGDRFVIRHIRPDGTMHGRYVQSKLHGNDVSGLRPDKIKRVVETSEDKPAPADKPKGQFKVTDEMKAQEDELRKLLGIDDDEGSTDSYFRDPDELTPEQKRKVFSLGVNYAFNFLDNGVTTFPDFAKAVVGRLGSKVKPFIKSWYEGAKRVPGYGGEGYTDSADVDRFDIENFDKPSPDAIRDAEMRVAERKAKQAAEQAEKELIAERNEKRKKDEQQTAADTAALAEKAEAVASEAESHASLAGGRKPERKTILRDIKRIDDTLDEVNSQLALLGYYEADLDAPEHEVYGLRRSAEKKAVKDAVNLAKQLVDDLGIELDKVTGKTTEQQQKSRGKNDSAVRANVAPAGGDIVINLPYPDGRNLYINIGLSPTHERGVEPNRGGGAWEGDNYEVDRILFRFEGAEGRRGENHFLPNNVTYGKMLSEIERASKWGQPKKQDASKAEQKFPDSKDNEAVSKWLEDNSAAIWKGVDAIMVDARHDENLLNTFRADNSEWVQVSVVGEFVDQWIGERLEEMMSEHPATVKAWFDYGQRGLMADVIAERMGKIIAEDKASAKAEKTYNGYKIGDEIMWDRYGNGKWEKQRIADFDEDGRPILDSFGQNWITELADWERIKPADGIFGEAQRVARATQEKKTPATPTKKKTAVKPEQQVGDLFGGLFDEPENSDNNVKRESDTKGQGMAKGERSHTMGDDAPRTDGGKQSRGTEPTDKVGAADAERSDVERGTDGTAHGTEEERELQQPAGNRGRDEVGTSERGAGAADERGGTSEPRHPSERETDNGGKGISEREPSAGTREGGRPASVKDNQKKPERKYTRNFRYEEDENEADSYTPKQRLEANVKAIETLADVLFGGKPATDEQKAVISRFRGWGQVDLGNYYDLDHILRSTYVDTPLHRLAKAIQKLDPQGEKKLFSAIKQASLSSYYTPTKIAKAINSFLTLAGFRGGKFLDPSMGNGMFEGTMPQKLQERTEITGVELDWLSGQLSRILYPDANVIIGGFEKSALAPGSYDVVSSNVPFGSIEVNDPTWKSDSTPLKRAAQNRIHNYYAVKMLEALRPGGLLPMMTTTAVMDTRSNQIIREHIAMEGEILGAVRLPDNTFQGTGVNTDVIFVRKWRDEEDRMTRRADPEYQKLEQAFLSSATTTAKGKNDGRERKVEYNGYYALHPENMIGEVQAGNQYKEDAFGLTSRMSVDEIASAMEKAIKRIVGNRRGKLFDVTRTVRESQQAVRAAYKGDGDWVSNGNLVIQDGKVGVLNAKSNEYGEITREFEGTLKHDKMLPRIKAMIDVRTAMKRLIAGQIEGENDKTLASLRGELQKAYDAFVDKYGRLHDSKNAFILDDIDGYTLQALEKWKSGKFEGLSDIFTKNTIKSAMLYDEVKTPQDAISASLAEYGYVRPDFISKSLGDDWATKCSDFVFLNPNTEDDYVTRDEYLSGDVVTKLADAREAAKSDDRFEKNVKALEEVQPTRVPFDDIAIGLGARWIPDDILNDFVQEIFGLHAIYSNRNRRYDPELGRYVNDMKSGVRYIPEIDSYEINIDSKELGGAADEWETPRKSAKEILKAALEDKSLVIKKRGDEDVVDEEQTELANQKIEELRERFEQWLPANPDRVERLEQEYNDRFNRTVKRKFNGQHLVIPGLMGMELRPHQKDAVWMLINNRGGIVDHIVGAGKTLVMQAAIMEMRRMGIAKKPMIVALKSTVSQIAREFKEAFPSARVLAPNDSDFQKENRKKFIANISLNDYDCVILSHEQYGMLPHTEEAEQSIINEQLQMLDNMIEYLYGTDQTQLTKRQIKALETRRKNLIAKMEKRLDRKVDREFCFENLGVDYLFVDESHQFKSLPYVTSYQQIAGLQDAKGSNRAVALLTGIRHLQKMHQGDKGVVFLSGTTITNSLVEIYNLLNCLRPREMQRLGMTTFDAWASIFADHTSELEAGTTGEFRMKDRFRSFKNVPELSQLYAEIADVRNDSNLKLPKPALQSKTVIVPASDAISEINREIIHMLNTRDGSYFGINPDNPDKYPWGLRAATLSANAAVSPRLLFPDMDDDGGKVGAVCANVKKYYDEMADQKGVQLVFCELGVPGKDKSYDVYTDIIGRLTDSGIPKSEIAYIQQATTEEKRKDLFQRVRDGKVRILIGGTKNMGTGVNVQTRITDMHMVTVPWTPSALEQCLGRGGRQGNIVARDFMGNKVRVHYYATEGSLDLYKYQLLDAKGKMFTQFKMGTVNGERTFDEGAGEEDGFDPAEMVARLSGNPVIFERAKQDKKVKKLRALRNGFERDYQRKKAKFTELTDRKEKLERLVRLNERDVNNLEREGFVKNDKGIYPSEVMVIEGSSFYGGRRFDKPKEAGEYILDLLSKGKSVTLAGFGKHANIVRVNEEADGLFASHHELHMGDGKSEIKYTTNLPADPTAVGLAFRSLLEKVMRAGSIYSRDLEETKNKLNGLNIGDGVFPRQAELDEAVAKLKELNAEYNKLGRTSNSEDSDKSMLRPMEEGELDTEMLESLTDDELVPVFRNVQVLPGMTDLASPMAAKDLTTGAYRTIAPRQWNGSYSDVQLTEEQQRMYDELAKNGYVMIDGKKRTRFDISPERYFEARATKEPALMFKLDKGVDGIVPASENPYDHGKFNTLNLQFATAHKRPNLVMVQSVMPKSELRKMMANDEIAEGMYHAPFAKNSTGVVSWTNGDKLALSRWSKIIRVLTNQEVAERINALWQKNPAKSPAESADARDPFNYTPQVLERLQEMGWKFDEDKLAKLASRSPEDVEASYQGMPYVTDEDIARLNAKYADERHSSLWNKEPDEFLREAEENTMADKVQQMSERMNTPVRILRTPEEIEAYARNPREAKAKGISRIERGGSRVAEIAILLPNNKDLADVENTFLHEGMGHDGLRLLFPTEKLLNNALDELYNASNDAIKADIDARAKRMYDAEVDRIFREKQAAHESVADANSKYYTDMAEAHAEANAKREQMKRDATEEYGANVAGKVGEKGFEKMTAEEQTFWGKMKALLQQAFENLLRGLKIPKMRKWTDKQWAYIYHKAYKMKKAKGKMSVIDEAEVLTMRRKTGYDADEKSMYRDPDMSLEETITKMKAEAMQANADNLQAKCDAMRAIGGNLNHLRQAMARQREYDITTVKSVTDLAKILMDAGLLDDMSKFETKRILGAVNNVVGKQDVSQYVQKVMDIMVDNQLRNGAGAFGKLLAIRGSRVDARGIEVQGELDPDGQRIAQAVRKSTTLPKDDIDNRIVEAINRMSSTDQAIADEATLEYAGLQIARQYVEDITESKAEEKALRDSIKQAKEDKGAGQMTDSAYRQYVASTEDAIRQNKIERAEAYQSLIEQMGDALSASVERAKAWREAEKQRVEEIHHNANSDMEGRPTDEHHKDDRVQKMANNSFARFLLAPLGTFDQMLRMFGKKNVRGEGYLWNRYMRGWVEATEKEYTGYRDALKILDAKVSEIYGKKMTWGDLFSIDRKLPKASVRFFDGGEMKDHELTQGNLLYIYMADKMSDGRMKLRRMGITEEDIEDIKNFLDPKFIQLADWMQEEFLVDKRNEYNEVHKRMFGASMAAIENYFPLKILANARLENVDVADDTTDTALPATSTGSIIKRRRNNLALDVTGANAFSVILDHLQQMERWAAFAEFNRDLNTLLSYKRFRNQVMNMSSVYGGGKTLWNNFRNVCSMAAGAYRPPIAALDKAAVNIAKGVTAAKVSFRVFTALKQFLSMPAYISDSNPMYLATNIANPIGAWRWSMKNLPLFEKRWSSRMAGDPRLLKSDMDWKMWRSRIVEIASRVGMSPNAFVDALTVAIGSHSMYQTKLAKYKRQGYDPDVAEARAKQDATILFNQTQQSSEGAFLSTMQVDRSWLSVLFTVFRNSSMSYTRQLYDSIRNLGRRFTPGYKGLSEEFMAKQMRRDGIDPDKADRNAKQEYRRGIIRDLVRVGVFGYILQLAWNLGAYLPYLILGEDEEEKDKMWQDVWNHTMFGSIEGLTGGDVMSAAGNMWVSGEGNPQYLTKDMPLASDVLSILKKMDKDQVSAMNDVINLLVQSTVGVNPQSLTDAVVAVIDYCGDDAETSRECALLIARVLNCPQSQLDKIYFDELDASGEEASQMTPSEIAERYARYKVRRGAPLTGWAYGNEQREKLMDKYRDRSNTLAKERLTRETDKQASQNMAQWLEEFEATKDRVSEIKKVKSRDEDRYYELLDELEITPEYDRYEIIKGYKRDVDVLTKEWLKATTPAQRDSCVQAIIGLKSDMVRELMNTQQ